MKIHVKKIEKSLNIKIPDGYRGSMKKQKL
jgi:hypothetical protein